MRVNASRRSNSIFCADFQLGLRTIEGGDLCPTPERLKGSPRRRPTMNEREIFINALQRDAADREAYLEQACGSDAALRKQVEALLAEQAQLGSFLESPAPALGKTVDKFPLAWVRPHGSVLTSCWSRSVREGWAWSIWLRRPIRSNGRWP